MMIDNPIRKAFESIDDDATDKFRDALRKRCLAELIAGDASDPTRSGRSAPDDQFVPMKEMYMSPIDPHASDTSNRRRLLVTAAAVTVVVVGVSGILLANNNNDDQNSAPAAAATAAPATTIAATTTVAPTQNVSFAVDSAPGISVSFTAPQSWTVLEGWTAYLPSTDDRSAPAVVGLGFEPIGNIFADGCQWVQLDPPVGPTIDDLVEAWTNLPSFATTDPVDVTVDGYAGKQIEFTVPDYTGEDCRESHFGLWYTGPDPLPGTVPPGYWAQGPQQHIQQWIVDVDGTRLVIFAGILPSASPQDRAALDEALASIQIG